MKCPLYLPTQTDAALTWDATEYTLPPLRKKPTTPIALDIRKIDALKETKFCHDSAWEASVINTPNVLSDSVSANTFGVDKSKDPKKIVHKKLSFFIKIHIEPLQHSYDRYNRGQIPPYN